MPAAARSSPRGSPTAAIGPTAASCRASEPDAFVEDPDEAVAQAAWLVRERGVRTLCVHGDNPQALAFVRALRDALTAAGFTIQAVRMSLRVLEPGLADAGRRCRPAGEPQPRRAARRGGGPVLASLLGNALVGNPPDAAALEVCLAGPTLQAGMRPRLCRLRRPVRGVPRRRAAAGRADVHAAPRRSPADRRDASRGAGLPVRPRRAAGTGRPRQPVGASSRCAGGRSWRVDRRGCRAGRSHARRRQLERRAGDAPRPARARRPTGSTCVVLRAGTSR